MKILRAKPSTVESEKVRLKTPPNIQVWRAIRRAVAMRIIDSALVIGRKTDIVDGYNGFFNRTLSNFTVYLDGSSSGISCKL